MYIKSDSWFWENKKEVVIGTTIFRLPDLNKDEYRMHPKRKFELVFKIKAPPKPSKPSKIKS